MNSSSDGPSHSRDVKTRAGPNTFLQEPLRTKQYKLLLTLEEHRKLATLCKKRNQNAADFFRAALLDACQKDKIK